MKLITGNNTVYALVNSKNYRNRQKSTVKVADCFYHTQD